MKTKTPEINPAFRISSNKLFDLLEDDDLILLENFRSEKCFTRNIAEPAARIGEVAETDRSDVSVGSAPGIRIGVSQRLEIARSKTNRVAGDDSALDTCREEGGLNKTVETVQV